MKARILLLLLILTVFHVVVSQSIKGRVTDAETGEAMSFATVYLENSTIGDITDKQGKFTLRNLPVGKYIIAASFVGYDVTRHEIVLSEGGELTVNLQMSKSSVMLKEVEVVEDLQKRKEYLAQFKSAFLGATSFSNNVRIENDEVLYFKEFEDNTILRAFAGAPIEVTNKALGYRIYYSLIEFSFNKQSGLLRLFGSARFEELRKKTRKKSLRNRQAAYEGSLLHFFRWIRDPDRDESYTVRAFQRKVERVDTVKVRLGGFKVVKNDPIRSSAPPDATTKTKLIPKYKDIVGGILDAGELAFYDVDNKCFLKGGSYYIIYRGKSLPGFTRPGLKTENPTSLLFIYANNLLIYANGGVDNPGALYTEGYWSWAENASTLLPMDYRSQD